MLRFLLYEVVCWTLLGVAAYGTAPGLTIAVAIVALYTTVPLLLFLRWRGWPFYPGAAFRLLVVRVALYAQLLLPIVAAAAAVGLLAGWPLGIPLLLGRVLAVRPSSSRGWCCSLATLARSGSWCVKSKPACPGSRVRSTGFASSRSPISTSARTPRGDS